MENRIVLPANPMEDGTCRPIKRQYQQTSLANFIRGGGYAATGVIEIVRYEADNNDSIPQYNPMGGYIQPREQDFVISEEGISMSLPASYNLHCFKIMEIVRYEDIQDISVSERRE